MSDEIILAFDCARRSRSVALVDLEGATIDWASGSTASSGAGLLPLAEKLMGDHGVDRSRLSALSVSSGPGSFTGVRVGLATAMGLAVGLDIPVFGISTLRALHRVAEGALDSESDLFPVAVLPAGRGHLFLGFSEDGGFREIRIACEAMSLSLPIETGILFAGEGVAADRLTPLESSLVSPLPPLAPVVGELGAWRLAAGDRGDPASLKARYLRGSGARLPVPQDLRGVPGVTC